MTTPDPLRVALEATLKALDAQMQMRGKPQFPKKLDEALAWKENDELADRMAAHAKELSRAALAGEAGGDGVWQVIEKAIDDEPEYPDDMPNAMWKAIRNDRDASIHAFRTTVHLTKEGIKERIRIALLAPRPAERERGVSELIDAAKALQKLPAVLLVTECSVEFFEGGVTPTPVTQEYVDEVWNQFIDALEKFKT